MREALAELKAARGKIAPQAYKTIRGQILSGDKTGALKGLKKLLRRDGKTNGKENNVPGGCSGEGGEPPDDVQDGR